MQFCFFNPTVELNQIGVHFPVFLSDMPVWSSSDKYASEIPWLTDWYLKHVSTFWEFCFVITLYSLMHSNIIMLVKCSACNLPVAFFVNRRRILMPFTLTSKLKAYMDFIMLCYVHMFKLCRFPHFSFVVWFFICSISYVAPTIYLNWE